VEPDIKEQDMFISRTVNLYLVGRLTICNRLNHAGQIFCGFIIGQVMVGGAFRQACFETGDEGLQATVSFYVHLQSLVMTIRPGHIVGHE
jgi:hypothetical protein